MTNKEFLIDLQKACRFETQQCSMFINALCRMMAQAGVEQIPVTLEGLGTFVSHKHPEYIQEDPLTGQQTLFPPRITYRMHAEQPTDELNPLPVRLSENTHASTTDCQLFLDSMVNIIKETLSHNEEVEISGLGVFRIVSNSLGDLQRIAYSPDDKMRQQVNAPFNCFEPIKLSMAKQDISETVAHTAVVADPPSVPEDEIVSTSHEAVASVEIPEMAVEPEVVKSDESESVIEPEPVIFAQNDDLSQQTTHCKECHTNSESQQAESLENRDEENYDDEDEEENAHHRKPLYFTLLGLALLLVGCLIWFFGFKITNNEPPVVVAQIPEQVQEKPVDVAVAGTIDAHEDTLSFAESIDDDNSTVVAEEFAEPEKESAVAPKEETAKPVIPVAEVSEKTVEPKPEVVASESKGEVSPIQPTSTPVWRIQFLTSGEVYKPGDSHLGGLTPVSYYQETKYYKYTYGAAANKVDLKSDMEKVRKVFKDAFYVQFNADGTRIK